nr:Wzz/FepE/Etk N-terminal domain-containing protein [Neobacillus sp. Marseille-Q6967]
MEKEINIKRLFNIVKKRIWIVIVTTIISSTFAAIYSVYFTTPLYESSSRIIVNAQPDLMNTLMVVIKEPTFLEHVINEEKLDRSPEELSQQITAGSIAGSSIVKISVVDTNPRIAANIADAVADVFKNEIPKILGFSDIRIFSKAKVISNPINLNHEKKIVIGIMLGLIAGVGIIFLLDFLDNTVKSERSIEDLLGIPVIGNVSRINKKNTALKKTKRLTIGTRGDSVETYR